MSSLYHIAEDLRTVIEGGIVFDEETGEVLFDADNLDQLETTAAKKCEAVTMYAAGRRALAKARKEAAKAMSDSAKALEREADRLDEYALDVVRSLGGKLETESITVKVRKNPPKLEVIDYDSVPSDYLRVKTSYDVDKAKAKADIMAGIDVPGCAVVQSEKLVVR